MNKKRALSGAQALARAGRLCALAGLAVAAVAAGDIPTGGAPYERMAPLEQYLMKPDAEIALARSAAPAAISGKATILTLKAQGYEKAIDGTNGFTCIVERGWTSPFGHPQFWNPKIRAPICYNAAASESILVYTLRRTKLALGGPSKARLLDEVHAAVAHRELPQPGPGAMSYMMSKDGYLGDDVGHWHSHLMFHVPRTEGASWGANLRGSPVVLDTTHGEFPEPATTFYVPVDRWSDGTAAPPM